MEVEVTKDNKAKEGKIFKNDGEECRNDNYKQNFSSVWRTLRNSKQQIIKFEERVKERGEERGWPRNDRRDKYWEGKRERETERKDIKMGKETRGRKRRVRRKEKE